MTVARYIAFTNSKAADMTASPSRLHAIDSAKGIGIILVVFGHAWRGAMGAGLIPTSGLFELVDRAIYAFHMPLFFFLSGLLFLETLRKYATGSLLRGRISRLLWPMALWTWVFFGLKLFAGQSANTPVALAEFPIIPLPPYEHLWFLWALFLCQSLLILGYATPIGRFSDASLRWGAAAAALVLALVNPFLSVPSFIWGPMVEHFPYFLAGIAAGGLSGLRPSVLTGALAAAAFFLLLSSVGGEKAAVILSLALVLLAWQAWRCADRSAADVGPVLEGLRYLGQVSMVIYLTHTIFSAALRIAMLSVGVNNLFLVLVATTAVGLIAPVFVLVAARRAGLTKLLGF